MAGTTLKSLLRRSAVILEILETGMLTATAHTLEQDVVKTCCKKLYSFINDIKDVEYRMKYACIACFHHYH